MKSAVATIVGESPYSQGKHYTEEDAPRKPKELHDAYEQRTWRHRMHATKDGRVEIPGMAFANCIKAAAKRLKIQVPGKGRVEYTKYIEAGVMVMNGIVLPVRVDDVPCDRLFVPSDGRVGGGKRVMKYFPRIDEWGGKVTFYIFDDLITDDVFRQVLVASGMLVGIGRFRPENRGYYGRFSVPEIAWNDDVDLAALGKAA